MQRSVGARAIYYLKPTTPSEINLSFCSAPCLPRAMVGVEVKIPRTPKYNVDFFAALPTMSQRPSMRVLNIVSGEGRLNRN